MFFGKTEELIRRLKRAQFAKQRVEIFKPAIDTRYDEEMVVSHNKNEIRSTPVPAAANIALLAQGCDVVGIDEAQFFDDEIVKICNDLANNGVRVIVAGLDMDFKGNPFELRAALVGTTKCDRFTLFALEQEIWRIIASEKAKTKNWLCLVKPMSTSH